MALGATTVLEVRQTGADTNGGGFNPGNANFPTDGTTDTNTGNTASPVFSSASYNFVAGDVGAVIYIKSGTNSIPGYYKIASVASNKATLSAAVGAAVLDGFTSLNTALGIASVGTPTALVWGIDYSQQDSAQFTFTDLVIDATTNTKFTSAAHPVGKNFIGNLMRVTSGTNFTVQTVEIVSTSSTVATCDKSLGTTSSTAGHGGIGGALGSPGMAGGIMILTAGIDVFIKYNATPYSIASVTANVTTGCMNVSVTPSSATNGIFVTGYDVTRIRFNSDTNRPTAKGTVGTLLTIFETSGNGCIFANLIADCNTQTTSTGFYGHGLNAMFYRCTALNATKWGFFNDASFSRFIFCNATGGGSAFFAFECAGGGAVYYGCEAYGNASTGFKTSSGSGTQDIIYIHCLSYSNTGVGSHGFLHGSTNDQVSMYAHCTAYGNGGAGFSATSVSTVQIVWMNCISTSNTTYGFDVTALVEFFILMNCAVYNNTTANVHTAVLTAVYGLVTLTGDPFTNAASGDLSLNNTAGAGLACRAAGLGTFQRGTTTSFPDIGAAQVSDTAGAGVNIFGRRGNILGAR